MIKQKLPKITLVVLTYNRLDKLKNCINSLIKQTYSNYDILVIDNHSKSDTYEYLETLRKHKNFNIIHLPFNYYIEGFSIGMSAALGDFVAMFDDDHIIPKDWTKKVVNEFLKEPPTTGIIWTKVIEKGYKTFDKRFYSPFFSGGGCVFRKEVIRKIGVYNKKYVQWITEANLAIRVTNRGYKILYIPYISFVHDKPERIKQISSDNRSNFYHYRNSLWLIWMHYPWYLIPIETLFKIASALYKDIIYFKPILFIKTMWSAFKGLPYCLRHREPAKHKLPMDTLLDVIKYYLRKI
tara:strand:- start:1040 stop:1924 length:885 start_codon:yes stop_codon:yes gene_type:complete